MVSALGRGRMRRPREEMVGVMVKGVGEACGCGRGVRDDGGILCCTEERKFASETVDLFHLVSIHRPFWVEQSKHNILTTASCSFSSCRCKSAAVKGLGCLNGPGPIPTPVLCPIARLVPAAPIPAAMTVGEASGDAMMAPTVLWLLGRIFRLGDVLALAEVTGGIIC